MEPTKTKSLSAEKIVLFSLAIKKFDSLVEAVKQKEDQIDPNQANILIKSLTSQLEAITILASQSN